MSNHFFMPKTIYSGSGALSEGKVLFQKSGKRVFLVSDPLMVKFEKVKLVEDMLKELQIEVIIFSDVTGEPTLTMVEKGFQLYKQQECDFMIALGGGSVLDCAKAIAMTAVVGGVDKLHEFMGKSFDEPVLPLIAIPTTAGTGSEVTQFAIITDEVNRVKMLLRGSSLLPSAAIVDPSFSMSTPTSVTASTGVDALCHAIESYLSKKAQPLSKVQSVSAIKRILKNLSICVTTPNDVEARNEMALAALEAGIAFNNASVTIVHGMSRPIGALFHIPHGESNAMLLRNCLCFIQPKLTKQMDELAEELHILNESGQGSGELLIQKISAFLSELPLKSLRDYGVEETTYRQSIAKMCEDALNSGSPQNLDMTITAVDLAKIYENIY